MKKISVLSFIVLTISMLSLSAQAQSPKNWTIVATYDLPDDASGLAFDGTHLYCGIYGVGGDAVYQIDPSDGSYSLYFSGGAQEDAYGLTHDGTYLWTTDHPGSSSEPAVAMQLDASGAIVSQFDLPDHYMSGIAFDAGDFWVSTYYDPDGHIYKLDNTGAVITDFAAPDNQPWDLCMADGDLWMADRWGDMLYQINATDGTVIAAYPSESTDPAGIVYDGTFLWYTDAGTNGVHKLYKVDLSGTGTPVIYLPQTEHDFGPVTIGSPQTWDMSVHNNGTGDLTLSGLDIPAGVEISSSAVFPLTISPSASVDIPLTYSPLEYEPLDVTLVLNSDDPVNPASDIHLTGTGVVSGAQIYTVSDSYDFGQRRSSSFSRMYITIYNSGDTDLDISQLETNLPEFIVGTENVLPLSIAPESSAEIALWYHPGTDAAYSGDLNLISSNANNSPYTLTLSGTADNTDKPIGSNLWNYTIAGGYDNSPKAMERIPDITGDGIADLIVCSEDNTVRCINGNASAQADVLWENSDHGSVYQQTGLQISEDINSDGYSDVFIATVWGDRSVVALSGKTGEQLWKYDTHQFGEGGWVYAADNSYDYNDDGVADVLACSGDDADGTGPKRVHCLDALTGDLIWDYASDGPVFSVKGVRDFTGDGQADVICGTTNAGETQGKAVAIDGSDGSFEWSYETYGTSVWALAQLPDVNLDGTDDIIVGSYAFSGNGYYYFLNAQNGEELFSDYISGASLVLRFEKMQDVNQNGKFDILVSHSGSNALIVDGYTGEKIWTYPVGSPDKPWTARKINDITGDGINDVIVGTLYTVNEMIFLDGTDGYELHTISYGQAIDAVGVLSDICGDESDEVVAGGRDGHLVCYSGGLLSAYGQINIPDAIDFGTVTQGSPESIALPIINDGNANLQVDTLIISDGSFYSDPEMSFPMIITPGMSEDLLIFCDPLEIGSITTTAELQSNDPNALSSSLDLSANGTLNNASVQTENFRMYPNPANDYLYVESDSPIESVKLMSIDGRVLKSFRTDENHIKIYVGDLAAGVYVLLQKGETQTYRQTISVK